MTNQKNETSIIESYKEDCSMSKEDFIKKYKVNEKGLSSKEANSRIQNLGLNEIKKSKPKRWYNYFLKSLFAEFIPNVFISILELICARLFLIIFNIDYNVCAQIPLFRLIITLSIYIILFVIYKLIKHFNFNITILDN